MLVFDPPDFFRPTYKLYPELWTIVSSPKACLKMRMAAYHKKPVVFYFDEVPDLVNFLEYIDEHDPKSSKKVRNLIGHMCAKVMEIFRYDQVDKKVSLPESHLFKYSASYLWWDYKTMLETGSDEPLY